MDELTDCLKGLGEVVVLAPDGPRSGMSGAITSHSPITYSLVRQESDLTVYSSTGTPVDCVKLALNEVLDRQPDLLISGINQGGNFGICVHYSGTMGAVMEGCIWRVPSFGVSLMTHHSTEPDFSEASRIARRLAEKVLLEGLPEGTFLNLNIPYILPVKGVAVCFQANGRWINEFDTSEETDGQRVYHLTGEYQNYNPPGSEADYNLLCDGYATLVPCKIDMTDYDFMHTLRQWDW
ncbi:MAG: 5'/3'-nucleotidase SurE [Tannerella sp.]|nr:5'/3'-nucleotidase SurE [Tannerella sp.]